jgi:hypothetical protein
VTDKELKARIRAELFRCAFAGDFLTYTQFFHRIRPDATMGIFLIKRTSTRSRERSAGTVIPPGPHSINARESLRAWESGDVQDNAGGVPSRNRE